MAKTNPAWDATVKDDYTKTDDMTPEEANAVGDALNELLATDAIPGASRIGFNSNEFDIDGEQSLENLLETIFSGTPGEKIIL